MLINHRRPIARHLIFARKFSDDSTRTAKGFVYDFGQIHQAATRTVSLIQQVLASPEHQNQLAFLRDSTNKDSLWDDANEAATLLQQLSVLEKRQSLASYLVQNLTDTKDLFDIAMDENDESVLLDCIQSVEDAETSAKKLHAELLLSEPTDPSSCFLEIHAGAAEIVNAVYGDEAGYRSVCLRVDGSYAYGWLKTEGGVHRLVRISPFDSQSRRHTSFAQVRVFPLAAASPRVKAIEISTKDLRIDTYRASGPGGQHVNKTESAIRITHLPTNIVVQCQSDRSQHRNKDTAMEMLRSKLMQLEIEKQDKEKKKYTQGLGDNAWGSQIRSYVLHPYKMVKDHRTNYSSSDTKGVLDGDISSGSSEGIVRGCEKKMYPGMPSSFNLPRSDMLWLCLALFVSIGLYYEQYTMQSIYDIWSTLEGLWWLKVPFLTSIGFLGLYVSVRRLVYFFSKPSFRDGPYILGRHQWRANNSAGPLWCNVCDSMVIGIRSYVVSCDICGITAHGPCALRHLRTQAQQKCPCKLAAIPQDCDEKTLEGYKEHVWVKGNIDPLDTCELCGLYCGSILALSAMKCIWCHRRVHESCFQTHGLGSTCDYGPHRQLVLPPTSIRIRGSQQKSSTTLSSVKNVASLAVKQMKMTTLRTRSNSTTGLITEDGSTPKMAMQRTKTLQSETPLPNTETTELPFIIDPIPESTPLLVFINSRSGGQMGLYMLRQLRRWLNPLQIYDLSVQGPEHALIQFCKVPGLRILVCGGDGSVGWVLGAIDNLSKTHFQRQPPVGILPLGTGNDLARVLGWGGGYSDQSISDILFELQNAHISMLDRWRVDLNGEKRSTMNNYVGIGVDAQVALEFHEKRERSPSLFMNQFINKLWYSRYGAKNFLTRKCGNLDTKVELVCDGQVLELPSGIEGVIITNITSFAGGSVLWHEDSSDEYTYIPSNVASTPHLGPASIHDGLLDIVAVYGTLHLGQLQVGLSKALRICQAKKVQIRLKERLPLQIDGEPWMQDPCVVDITFHHQAFMMARTREERDTVTRQVGEVLDWAGNSNVITWEQRDILLAEITRRVHANNDRGSSALKYQYST